jgi:hypothetical protein
MCRWGMADSGLGAQAEVAPSGEMADGDPICSNPGIVRRLLVAVNL